ncbi:phenylacetate--CoA ligase family protein [Azonexus fungiphilus]|uniref:phenylacetate--CoA ligase family protein n=1 Tax=Azonexus fungiphilus TaxID=146940 RepID=UPI00156B009D|nr:AMP-binding protein [Azonexus fungiphilus]NHC06439.1 phenylacetate--CoA ligase [Azonexus fungiphilus]
MSYYDPLETRDPAAREADLMGKLRSQLAHAKRASAYYAQALADIDPAACGSRQALAALPLTRKRDLIDLQKATPPFGGLNALAKGEARRVFASPGPIYELQGGEADHWRMARVLYAAGFRRGELIHNCFSYHFTPGAFLMEGGARKLGCSVFPGGVGQTEQQVQAMVDLRPDGYVGTPSFLKIIVDKAEESGADISSLKKALVSGEALPGVTRAWLGERGIAVRQCYATADIGAIAYETEVDAGMVVEEDLLLEIVRPGTGDPVPPGEVGEVVVTTFNGDYPLIRFATGDLSALLPGISPCGRTNARLRGWLGRADQTTKIKGMFVHPEQIAEIARRHPEVARMRLVVDNPDAQDRMTLHCELAGVPDGLQARLVDSLREGTKLRGEVQFVAPGGLPNDGKVIEDKRVY